MQTIYIEFESAQSGRILEFIEETAISISEGYGGGNCTPESVAFWTTVYKPNVKPGWSLLEIELEQDELTDTEIAAAVRKVRDEAQGQIDAFGHVVGRWSFTPAKMDQV